MKKTKEKTRSSPTPTTSKKDDVIALLRRDGGAPLTEITEATGWLPHTARAMLTGLRKKGFAIDRTKVENVTRYAITGEPSA